MTNLYKRSLWAIPLAAGFGLTMAADAVSQPVQGACAITGTCSAISPSETDIERQALQTFCNDKSGPSSAEAYCDRLRRKYGGASSAGQGNTPAIGRPPTPLPSAPVVNGVRLANPANDKSNDRTRTSGSSGDEGNPTEMRGGNRTSCIHFEKNATTGYQVSNRCGDQVYVEIRKNGGGLYTIPLKPHETLYQYWGDGGFEYRACKGTTSTACR